MMKFKKETASVSCVFFLHFLQ